MKKVGHRRDVKVAFLLGNMKILHVFQGCQRTLATARLDLLTPSLKGGECQIPQISLREFGGFDIDLRGRCRNDYSVINSSDG